MNRPALLLTVLALAAPLAVASAGRASAAVPKCHGLAATIVGTRGDDVIYGTAKRDVIVAGAGDDSVWAGAGNDVVCGGNGADHLNGGIGADKLYGQLDRRGTNAKGTFRTGDKLRGGPGNDFLAPGTDTRQAAKVTPDAILWDDARRAVRIDVPTRTATGEGKDTFLPKHTWLIGSDHGDTIVGGRGDDLLSGERGADTIDGGAGDDYILGDATQPGGRPSADHIFGGPGSDQIYTTSGIDTVSGGPGNDTIADFAGRPDSLAGYGGNDLILANIAAPNASHEQQLDGGRGVDEVRLLSNVVNPTAAAATGDWDMAAGTMTFTVNNPIAILAGRFEKGTLKTFGATWTIQGTGRDNYVSVAGSNGATFSGLGGDDSFVGSVGDDTFNGGAGTDEAISMGPGTDTCNSVEVIDVNNCEIVVP